MANHYQILDVDNDADQAAIKAAYRKLSKRYHPDITGDPKGHLFSLVNEAYATLSDEKKRADYDRTLGVENNGYYRPEPESNSSHSSSSTSYPSHSGDPSEIPYPKVNWNKMSWFKKDYSDIKERIILPRNGMLKGILGGAGFILGTLFMALASLILSATGFLICVILGVAAVIGWFKYISYSWDKVRYGIVSGLFPAFSLYSMFSGLGRGPELPLVIFSALVVVGLYLLGFWSAHRWQYWQSVKFSRGTMVMSVKDITDYVSWGKPGQLDSALGKFTERNIALGATGEKMTAELMQQLLKIPGTRIFHGLKFPGSENADVDHAIINGDKIVLVDSKMWAGGSYRWGYDGMIIRSNGSTSADLHTNFPYAVDEYRKDFTEAQVRGRILIHSNNGSPVSVDNSDVSRAGVTGTEMNTVQQFFEETGEWFAENNTGIIHRGLMNTLLYRMK